MRSLRDIKNRIHPSSQSGHEYADQLAALENAVQLLSFEEQEELETYSRQLIEEAYALLLSLQEKYNGTLGADGDDTGELVEFETGYRLKLLAVRRLHRRFDAWEWIRQTVELARKRLEKTHSEFVN